MSPDGNKQVHQDSKIVPCKIIRAQYKMHILNSKTPISSQTPMIDYLLESSQSGQT